MATQFTGLLGDFLGYMQDPNRTQAMQGIGGLLQSGLTSMDESQAKFRDLQKRAFGDKKNPMKVTDQAAFDQLTEMTMSGPMAFAPIGMTKALSMNQGANLTGALRPQVAPVRGETSKELVRQQKKLLSTDEKETLEKLKQKYPDFAKASQFMTGQEVQKVITNEIL